MAAASPGPKPAAPPAAAKSPAKGDGIHVDAGKDANAAVHSKIGKQVAASIMKYKETGINCNQLLGARSQVSWSPPFVVAAPWKMLKEFITGCRSVISCVWAVPGASVENSQDTTCFKGIRGPRGFSKPKTKIILAPSN